MKIKIVFLLASISLACYGNFRVIHGRIVFDHSAICSKNFVYSPEHYAKNPDPDIPMRLAPKMYEDSLVYSFSNYVPDSSEVVRIEIYPFWTDSSHFRTFDRRFFNTFENGYF